MSSRTFGPASRASKSGYCGPSLAIACPPPSTCLRSTQVRALSLSLGLLSVACSGSTETYTSDADRGSTHALITVERRDVLGGSEPAQARAFASFVRAAPEVDASVVTRIAGLELDLPEVGHCEGASSRDGTAGLSPLPRVELLEAGDVVLETPEARVLLAPRAFPAVTNLVAGVVYTTRDRVAALPPGEPYALSVAGSPPLGPLSLSAEAPSALSELTLDGAPLGPDSALGPDGAELGWQRGSARDLVYVVVAAEDGARHATCAFRDDAGRGLLPPSALPAANGVNLSLHRLRTVALAPGSTLDAGELRFDFELVARVAIAGRSPRDR